MYASKVISAILVLVPWRGSYRYSMWFAWYQFPKVTNHYRLSFASKACFVSTMYKIFFISLHSLLVRGSQLVMVYLRDFLQLSKRTRPEDSRYLVPTGRLGLNEMVLELTLDSRQGHSQPWCIVLIRVLDIQRPFLLSSLVGMIYWIMLHAIVHD